MDELRLMEKIRRLENGLWPSERRQLAYQWFDRCARELLPSVLEKAELRTDADRFRSLPPMRDDAALAQVLGVAREIAPKTSSELSIDELKRSVPRGAFVVPHLTGWREELSRLFELSKFVAGALVHMLEREKQSLELLSLYVVIIAEGAGCAEQAAKKMLKEATAAASSDLGPQRPIRRG